MSGVVKTVKKVFKKVVNVVKKIIKPVAIAVAAYFTAGLALSAFGATSAFAASMPGFAGGGFLGTGIGGVAGTGIFTKAAVTLGVGGGLVEGALAAGTGAGTLAMSVGSSAVGAAAAPTATALSSSIAGAGAGTLAGAGAGGGVLAKAGASLAGMSLTDKLLMTKIGTDVAGALFGPTAEDIAEMEAIEAAKFRGAFYGMEAGGVPQPEMAPAQSAGQEAMAVPQQQVAPLAGAPQTQVPSQAVPDLAAAITPEQQQLLDGRATREELFPTAQSMPQQTTGPGQMQSNIALPESLMGASSMPDVRYI